MSAILSCLLLAFAGLALGRSTTATSATTDTSNDTETPSTKTIFLPLSNIGNIAASVITAAPDSTVWGLACLYDTTSRCTAAPSVTITDGPSTLIFTTTLGSSSNSLGVSGSGPATINCTVLGTTQAICAGTTSISGLGAVASTSTLGQSQMSFWPVTVTAGEAELKTAATETATESPESSSTESPESSSTESPDSSSTETPESSSTESPESSSTETPDSSSSTETPDSSSTTASPKSSSTSEGGAAAMRTAAPWVAAAAAAAAALGLL